MILAVLLVGVISAVHAGAQNPVDLDRLDDKLSRYVETKMPGWNHKRGEPMPGSINVLVATWSCPHRGVKVAILPHNSLAEARAAMREGVKYDRLKEELQGWETRRMPGGMNSVT